MASAIKWEEAVPFLINNAELVLFGKPSYNIVNELDGSTEKDRYTLVP